MANRTGKTKSARPRLSSGNARVLRNRKALSASLRFALDECGLTHETAAERVPATDRTIGAYARGERPLLLEILRCDEELYREFIRCEYVAFMRGRR